MYSFKWLLFCEIPTIEMNFRSAGIWAYLPSLHLSNWKWSLGAKRTRTKVKGMFSSKWRMVKRSSIQILHAQYWTQLSIQPTTNWTRVSWWSSQDNEWVSYSPINRWPWSRPQGFNSRPAWNESFGAPPLGHLVYHEVMGLGCWYAMSTGGRWNGSWKDFHLACSSNALQIGDWESRNGVATFHFMGEYPWRVGDFGAQQLSRHCRWRPWVVSAPEIEFCAPPPVGDPVNTTPWGSSTDLSPWTNPGGNNA